MTRTGVGMVQPKGSVEMLEFRLDQLRSRLAREQENSSNINGSAPSSEPEPPIEQSTDSIQAEEQSRLNGASGSGELSAGQSRRHSPDIGLLSLSAMAEPNCRAAEFLKGISMPGIISAITESYGGNPQSTSRIDALVGSQHLRQSPTLLTLEMFSGMGSRKTLDSRVVKYQKDSTFPRKTPRTMSQHIMPWLITAILICLSKVLNWGLQQLQRQKKRTTKRCYPGIQPKSLWHTWCWPSHHLSRMRILLHKHLSSLFISCLKRSRFWTRFSSLKTE